MCIRDSRYLEGIPADSRAAGSSVFLTEERVREHGEKIRSLAAPVSYTHLLDDAFLSPFAIDFDEAVMEVYGRKAQSA